MEVNLLFARETHVVGPPAGAPEYLRRDDDVRAAEVQLFDHPPPVRGSHGKVMYTAGSEFVVPRTFQSRTDRPHRTRRNRTC